MIADHGRMRASQNLKCQHVDLPPSASIAGGKLLGQQMVAAKVNKALMKTSATGSRHQEARQWSTLQSARQNSGLRSFEKLLSLSEMLQKKYSRHEKHGKKALA